MTGVETALLIVLSVAVITLIVALVLFLKRIDALSQETTEFLKVTRGELAETLQEIRGTSKNVSELVYDLSDTVGHLNGVLETVERLDPTEMAANAAGKIVHGAGVQFSSIFVGLKEAIHAYRHPHHSQEKSEDTDGG